MLSPLADATICGTGRMDTVFSGTVIQSKGFTLSKNGTNSLVINGATTLETFNINQGSVVVVNNASALGTTAPSVQTSPLARASLSSPGQ